MEEHFTIVQLVEPQKFALAPRVESAQQLWPSIVLFGVQHRTHWLRVFLVVVVSRTFTVQPGMFSFCPRGSAPSPIFPNYTTLEELRIALNITIAVLVRDVLLLLSFGKLGGVEHTHERHRNRRRFAAAVLGRHRVFFFLRRMSLQHGVAFLAQLAVQLRTDAALLGDVLGGHFLHPEVAPAVVVLHAELSQHHVRVRGRWAVQRTRAEQQQDWALGEIRRQRGRFGRARWGDPHRHHLDVLVDPGGDLGRGPRGVPVVLLESKQN